MTDDVILTRFRAEYLAYNDLTDRRQRDALRVLRELGAHAGMPLVDAGASQLKSYLATLVADGYAPGTVRKHRNMIRPFFTWGHEVGIVNADTLLAVRAVRLPRGATAAANGKPRPYRRDEVKKLWRDVDRKYPFLPNDSYLERFARGTSRFPRITTHAWRLQLDAIIALELFAGMRRIEVYNAKLDDISHENAYVVVRGAAKNREAEERVRAVPWTTPDMRRMVQDWLEFRAWLNPPHDFTWLCLYQQRHYLKPLRFAKFEELLRKLGGWEPHRLRHTACTEMLRAGYPIQEVQRIMGHARIQQTLAYCELLPDDLIKTAARQSDQLSSALSPNVRRAA